MWAAERTPSVPVLGEGVEWGLHCDALARAPETITVLEVVEAIDGSAWPFTCQEIRARGENAATPEECRRPCTIDAMMARAHNAWRASLRESTIADIGRRTPASVRRRNASLLAAASAT